MLIFQKKFFVNIRNFQLNYNQVQKMYIIIGVIMLILLFKKIKIKQLGKQIRLQSIKKTTYFIRYLNTIIAVLKPSSKKDITLLNHQSFEHSKSTIDWVYRYPNTSHKTKKLLILPGLTGNYHTNYVIDTINTFKDYPYNIGVYNYSLMSKEQKKGQIKIMKQFQNVLIQLKKKNPKQQIDAIGFSYGANQLIYYLGKTGQKSLISKAVAISNPFNLKICSSQLGWFYDKLICDMLIKKLQQLKHHFSNYQIDFKKVRKSKTVRQFDEHFTIKVYNYPTVDHYYQQLSSSHHIHNIKVPTLSISSEDDKISSAKAIPRSDTITYLITDSGGHVGFVDWKFQYWFLQPVQQFLTSIFN